MMSHRFSDTAYGLSSLTDDWRHRAACRDVDTDLFFVLSDRAVGVTGEIESARVQAQVDKAKAVCGRCSVFDDCLKWALGVGDGFAILAGTTPQERRAMGGKVGRHVRQHGGESNSAKTHCPKWHPYSPENTYRSPTGKRACRTCRREHMADQRAEVAS